jgi:hypothetical protein
VADNRHTELGGWHTDVLRETLKSFLRDEGLRGTGYDEDDLHAMEDDDPPYNEDGEGASTGTRRVECPECRHEFTPE